jgi:hypothetical protein
MLEVQTVSLDAVLLRGLLPDLRLREGVTLAARVLERRGDHGLLALAGTPVVAELPAELAAGTRLRLVVADLTGERVVLRVLEAVAPPPPAGPAPPAAPPAPAPAAVPVPLPLPGGLQARVAVAERDARGGPGGAEGEAGAASVALHYDSPRLGRLELRLVVAPGQVRASVAAPPGPAQALADARAGELRAALAAALDRPADVAVTPSRARVDRRA